MERHTDPCDLLDPREAVFLEVIGQVQEGVFLQVLAVTEDDEETLLLYTQTHVHTFRLARTLIDWMRSLDPDLTPPFPPVLKCPLRTSPSFQNALIFQRILNEFLNLI